MTCDKCGKKLTRLGVFQHKIYYRCPGCPLKKKKA